MSLTDSGDVHIRLGSLAVPSSGLPDGSQVARFRKLGSKNRVVRGAIGRFTLERGN